MYMELCSFDASLDNVGSPLTARDELAAIREYELAHPVRSTLTEAERQDIQDMLACGPDGATVMEPELFTRRSKDLGRYVLRQCRQRGLMVPAQFETIRRMKPLEFRRLQLAYDFTEEEVQTWEAKTKWSLISSRREQEYRDRTAQIGYGGVV